MASQAYLENARRRRRMVPQHDARRHGRLHLLPAFGVHRLDHRLRDPGAGGHIDSSRAAWLMGAGIALSIAAAGLIGLWLIRRIRRSDGRTRRLGEGHRQRRSPDPAIDDRRGAQPAHALIDAAAAWPSATADPAHHGRTAPAHRGAATRQREEEPVPRPAVARAAQSAGAAAQRPRAAAAAARPGALARRRR